MLRRPALLLAWGLLLAACAVEQSPRPDQSVRLRPCDDGGSGGVVIDGVCL